MLEFTPSIDLDLDTFDSDFQFFLSLFEAAGNMVHEEEQKRAL